MSPQTRAQIAQAIAAQPTLLTLHPTARQVRWAIFAEWPPGIPRPTHRELADELHRHARSRGSQRVAAALQRRTAPPGERPPSETEPERSLTHEPSTSVPRTADA